MSVVAEAGYLTDVEYTGHFYRFLSPSWLAYIASINGYSAPALDRPFTYCELGCGQGITSLVLAALHPNGEFHACDINPAHIEYAQRLRGQSNVRNVEFYAQSFGEMLQADGPQFDFVVAHGVYSWVPEAARAELREFLRRKLRPGGLAMVSYNAMPGWAHLQPIRQMMQAYANGAPGDSLDKAKAAFAHVNQLANNGAQFFKTNPAAAEHLKFMAKQDIRYIAHEYLTPHGDPFHFRDVCNAMSAVGLRFAGSMAARDNYVELMVPPRFQGVLAGAKDRVTLETHRDVIENSTFRQDLYAAQPEPGPGVRLDSLGTGMFCLTGDAEGPASRRRLQGLGLDKSPDAEAVREIAGLLSHGPSDVAAIRGVVNFADEHLCILLQRLVVAELIAPCPPVRPQAGWLPLNSALIEAGLAEQQQKVCLACPSSGSGTYSEVIYAAMIEAAAREPDPGEAAKRVLARVRGHRHPVRRQSDSGEARPATDQEILDYAGTTWKNLRDPADPGGRRLRLLGVLG